MAKGKGGKCGRKPGTSPEETAWLETYADRFAASSNHNKFYTEVLDSWMAKFGYSGICPSKGIAIADLKLDSDITAEPAEEYIRISALRVTAKQSIRLKLSNWFRNRYRRRKDDKAGINTVLTTMTRLSRNRPRKKTVLATYQALFWDAKMKIPFSKLWDSCQVAGVSQDDRIKMMNKFALQMWEQEPDEVKQDVKRQCGIENAQNLHGWKDRVNWTASAKSYAAAFDNMDNVLPSLADALSEYLGMAVLVTVVGPCSQEDGDVVVRSVQSTTSKDVSKQGWAESDAAGYRRFQDAVQTYGRKYFSEEECKARVVSNNAGDEDEDLDADGEDEGPADPVDAGDEDEVPDDPINARPLPVNARPVPVRRNTLNLPEDLAWQDLPDFDPDYVEERPRLPAVPGDEIPRRLNVCEPLDPALAARPAPSAASSTDLSSPHDLSRASSYLVPLCFPIGITGPSSLLGRSSHSTYLPGPSSLLDGIPGPSSLLDDIPGSSSLLDDIPGSSSLLDGIPGHSSLLDGIPAPSSLYAGYSSLHSRQFGFPGPSSHLAHSSYIPGPSSRLGSSAGPSFLAAGFTGSSSLPATSLGPSFKPAAKLPSGNTASAVSFVDHNEAGNTAATGDPDSSQHGTQLLSSSGTPTVNVTNHNATVVTHGTTSAGDQQGPSHPVRQTPLPTATVETASSNGTPPSISDKTAPTHDGTASSDPAGHGTTVDDLDMAPKGKKKRSGGKKVAVSVNKDISDENDENADPSDQPARRSTRSQKRKALFNDNGADDANQSQPPCRKPRVAKDSGDNMVASGAKKRVAKRK